MAKDLESVAPSDVEESLDEIYDGELTTKDYGFIIGPDGDLKSVFFPHDYFEIPEKVRAVFALFGVKDPESVNAQVSSQTLH